MKYFVSLIFAALVYGLKEPYEVPATKELCSVNAKVFSIYPEGVFTAVEDVNFLYGDEETKFYDGFEFNIKDHSKTVVERLVKERSDDQMFSLRMTLDKWHEVGTVVNKYAAKINHVTLDVGVDPHGFVAFEDILESYPRITFAANNDDHESTIMSLVKNHSKKINRKVGYTNYRPNDRGVEITYTAGI
ncbi:hypothetical protein DSO57_1008322 [Entomophthora muscae]|uniref:Uncharacterized protein n=1 Tax=Entomophthora muscae TaxID=34485 RepID=A0ACC2RLZ2_9FUNG|nr:hypothetical protein DSO57_1008322 [Entomophthora muscae]